MMSTAVTGHTGPWTLDDVERLPDAGDHQRYELLAPGVLTVTPAPAPNHQRASLRLAGVLAAAATQAGEDVDVLENVNVVLNDEGTELCVPDVAVVDADAAYSGTVRFSAADVLVVVEIVSPSTRTTDRRVKPDLYAGAGISHYWLVELSPVPTITVYRLRRSGDHVAEQSVRAGHMLRVTDPFLVAFDPADLTARPRPGSRTR
uniref:Uma2 family endonuclease n=1 Tax=Actinokineospora sp. CA-119265 TaxID=3239890 RepID=UPI003F4969F3